MEIGFVTWNTREELRAALASARRHAPGDPVLVVDNASTDGTAEMVRAEFPEVAIVVEDRNRGFAAGANRLLERTDGDLLLLNADVELTDGAVTALEAALRAHPRAAAIGPRLLGSDGRQEHSALPFPTLTIAALTNTALARLLPERWHRRHLIPGTPLGGAARRVDWVVGAALALRRDAVRALGGLDPSFFMYAEDLEWAHRAARAGWEIWYEPAATIVHLGNRSGAQAFGDLQAAAWLESTYAFARRAHGPAWAAAYFALNAAGAVTRYGAARLRQAIAPSEPGRRAVARWGPHVRYHVGGSRPLSDGRREHP